MLLPTSQNSKNNNNNNNYNTQNQNNYQLNNDQCDDYLFQCQESGDQCYPEVYSNHMHGQDTHPSHSSSHTHIKQSNDYYLIKNDHHLQTDQKYEDDNLHLQNNDSSNNDEQQFQHYEDFNNMPYPDYEPIEQNQVGYADYVNNKYQHYAQNNGSDNCIIAYENNKNGYENYKHGLTGYKIAYDNTCNESNRNGLTNSYFTYENSTNGYPQQQDNSYQIKNTKSNDQFNQNVIQVAKNYKNQQIQTPPLNQISMQVKLEPIQNLSGFEHISESQDQNNLRKIKGNCKQNLKSSYQNLSKFESAKNQYFPQEEIEPYTQGAPKVEQTFEQVLEQSILPVSCNYYQILQEYEKQQIQQKVEVKSEDTISLNNNSVAREDCAIYEQMFDSTHANSYPTPNNNEEDDEMELKQTKKQIKESELKIENEYDDFYTAKQILIQNSNKKNVVKNIMSAFKNFILEPVLHNYKLSDLEVVLELYNQTKKGIDEISEMQSKFKRYITSKNFNHYTIKLLIQHINYSNVFKYFLNGPIEEWVNSSKVSDISSHLVMIGYLKECFDDIKLIDFLKRHEKKRAHFQ